jgi:hypothetical protein
MRDDDALGGFLGLLTLGAVFFLGNKSGQKQGYNDCENRHRDDEIQELKRQIEYLRIERK